MIEIKSVAGRVLYSCEAADVRAALVEAVRRRADLAGADLAGAYLAGADLSSADLSSANLYCANLYSANLAGANLASANLYSADLTGANLASANLASAYLTGANLTGANLYRADLARANLASADLYRANLYCANLYGANLAGANLYCANLYSADLTGARNADLAIARTRILPDDGDVIGWKKCRDNRIVKLRVPDGVARSHGSGRKCRAAKAEVLAIFDHNGNPVDTAESQHDPDFVYRVGETVAPTEPFDTNPWKECATGIHFYITRAEAEAHA